MALLTSPITHINFAGVLLCIITVEVCLIATHYLFIRTSNIHLRLAVSNIRRKTILDCSSFVLEFKEILRDDFKDVLLSNYF